MAIDETSEAAPVKVVFRHVDAAVFLEHLEHLSDVAHELALIAMDTRPVTGVSPKLTALAREAVEMLRQYQAINDDAKTDALVAIAQGDSHFDLTATAAARDALMHARHLATIFEEIDEHARNIELMSFPASTSVAQLRRWLIGELDRQVHLGQ